MLLKVRKQNVHLKIASFVPEMKMLKVEKIDMKKRKAIKRLLGRQNDYDAMITGNTKLKMSYRRPGSVKK